MDREPQQIDLAIGPSNIAGQAYRWAEACIDNLGVSAFSFAASTPSGRKIRGASHKRILHHRVRPTLIKQLAGKRLLGSTTHLVAESFATITGDARIETLNSDLDWLRKQGTQVAVVFHGSDIRSPRRHLERVTASFFDSMPPEDILRREEVTAARRRLARASGLPIFVSTPDLLFDLPGAIWLPLATNASIWRSSKLPFQDGNRLRVLHVPSRRVPPIKGTSYIDPVLSRLSREGLVEYISPRSVAHRHMPDLVRSVDVVIDQLLTGSYGVAAIEAMAAGRLVIGNVSHDVRRTVEAPIPIIDCLPDALDELIASIASDPHDYSALAAAGPEFVDSYHSGIRSSTTLSEWLYARRPAAASD